MNVYHCLVVFDTFVLVLLPSVFWKKLRKIADQLKQYNNWLTENVLHLLWKFQIDILINYLILANQQKFNYFYCHSIKLALPWSPEYEAFRLDSIVTWISPQGFNSIQFVVFGEWKSIFSRLFHKILINTSVSHQKCKNLNFGCIKTYLGLPSHKFSAF